MRMALIILISGILVNNFVLAKFLGICPFLGVSKKLDSAIGMSIAVTFVMVMATAATYPVHKYLLEPNDMAYLQTIVFILIIAALVQLVEIVLKKYVPGLYRSLGVYLPLITTNCAVLGVTILNFQSEYVQNLGHAILNATSAGLGFMLAMVMFAGVRSRLEGVKIAKAFDGIPITLIAASIVSVAFMGFSGVIEGMFGV